MTQAFNLSQLANKVNTSGQLDASTGLYNQVPVANGGTGRSSVTSGNLLVGAGTSAMTELSGSTPGDVVTWNGSAWVSQAGAGGAMPEIQTFVAPGTWTKPASIKGVKVTVVGAGGDGGNVSSTPVSTTAAAGGGGGGGGAIEFIPAPSIPGPIAVTAGGGTSSFGSFCSATAGANAATVTPPGTASGAGGAGGSGTGGNINITGGTGTGSDDGGSGANSVFGLGLGGAARNIASPAAQNGSAATGRGAGGSGAQRSAISSAATGGAGSPGIVIVEEFY